MKETKIQFRRLTTSTFILGATCLSTVDEEAGNTHTHTNTKKKQKQKKQTAATHRQKPLRGKKKKERRKSSIFNLTLFCYRAATVAIFFMLLSDRIQSRATNKGPSVAAPTPRPEDPILTCLICGARLQTHACNCTTAQPAPSLFSVHSKRLWGRIFMTVLFVHMVAKTKEKEKRCAHASRHGHTGATRIQREGSEDVASRK